MLKKLNRNTAGITVQRPVKVLQFGDGNFLRGFTNWVVDVMNEKTDFNGDILVVRPLRKNSSAAPDDQDGLYHVVLNGIQQGKEISEPRLITCASDNVNPFEDFPAFLHAAENPELKFVFSNTTEAGITFLETDNDMQSIPESFPGKVTRLLYHRFSFFKGDHAKGLIFIPCELIEKNADTLRTVIGQYSRHWQLPADFIDWVWGSNVFCNSLVDRIVPGFPKEIAAAWQARIGFADNRMVAAEPFHLWVIEGGAQVQESFPADHAGLAVKFVKDLTPYRTRKVRILNGTHTAMTALAYLRGLRTVKESVDDLFIGEFIRKALFEEIIPTLPLPANELHSFAEEVLERFRNPFIRHELASIALNSMSKFKVRVLPSLLEYHNRTGKLPARLVLSFAALLRFYKGRWKGETLPVKDTPEVVAFFNEAWKSNDPGALIKKVLSNKQLWDADLTAVNGLPEGLRQALHTLDTF